MKNKRYNQFGLFAIIVIVLGVFIIAGLEWRKNSVKASEAAGDCYENIIAITFDDGPGYKTTSNLLDGLAERNVKATFFLIGSKVEQNKEIVERMHNEGHLIGNHTYSHVDLACVGNSSALQEIQKTNELIKSITGEDVKYIRPPFGKYNNSLIYDVNMTPVLWSIDPDDWKTTDVSYVVDLVVNHASCGDIILMHDIYDSSVTAALEIIDRLQDKGFVFVTVDQLLLD